MVRHFLGACCACALGAAPIAAAQPPADPAPPAEQRRPNLEGEAIGYLAVPALLVLVLIVGLLVGGGDEEPESP